MNHEVDEARHRHISQLIEVRIERLKAIAEISVRLSTAIRERQFGSMDRLLGERTAILETLVADAGAFENAARASAGSADASMRSRIAEAERLVAVIEAQDVADLQAMESAGNKTRIELEKVTLGSRVGRAYQVAGTTNSRSGRDLTDRAG
jgi:hypothetical protein